MLPRASSACKPECTDGKLRFSAVADSLQCCLAVVPADHSWAWSSSSMLPPAGLARWSKLPSSHSDMGWDANIMHAVEAHLWPYVMH